MELRHYYCMVFLRDEPCTTTDFKCTKYPTIQRANGKYFLYNIWQIVRQLGKWIRLKLLFYKNKPKSISENSLSSLVLCAAPDSDPMKQEPILCLSPEMETPRASSEFEFHIYYGSHFPLNVNTKPQKDSF